MEELKPCPFCGGKAKVNTTPNRGEFYVMCKNGDIEQLRLHITKSKAIKAWNRRPK